MAAVVPSAVTANVTLKPLGTYISGAPIDESGAEIVDYNPCLQRMYVTNGFFNRIDVVDISDPAMPTLVTTLPTTPDYSITSVTVVSEQGLVAASLARDSPNFHEPGQVIFFEYDTDTDMYTSLGTVMVGTLPDMLTVTPDGKYIMTANEGQPDEDVPGDDPAFVDADGSISIIDISDGAQAVVDDPATYVTTLTFDYLVGTEDDLRLAGVRIAPGKTAPEDFEPEYVAVSPDSKTAFVTLQENNAVAKVDIENKRITGILPLPHQNHEFIPLDPSNRDDAVTFRTRERLMGMRMPDSIAAFYTEDGKLYFATANEGDARDYGDVPDENRIADIVGVLDATAFPDTTDLEDDAVFGRLHVSVYEGETDVDTLYSYGTRSFSIFDEMGNLIFDSGMDFELYTLQASPANFNSNNDEQQSFDARSDDKGPEPEALTVGMVGDRIYAFIGLERVGGVMIYDVTEPAESFFVDYVNNRDFSVPNDALATDPAAAGDLGPEGFRFISEDDSPIKDTPLLLVANESSGTTTVYEIMSADTCGKGKGKGGKGSKSRRQLVGQDTTGSLVRNRSLNGRKNGKGGKGKKCPK